MRRLMPLILLAALGCEGSNEIVAPPEPTPSPTPIPGYRISGTVTRVPRGSTTITATSGGRQWTTRTSGSAVSGTYQFVSLPAGEFQVSASAPSWCGPRTKTVTIPPDATVDFALMCLRAPDDPNRPEK